MNPSPNDAEAITTPTDPGELLALAGNVLKKRLKNGKKVTKFSPTGESHEVTEEPTSGEINAAVNWYKVAREDMSSGKKSPVQEVAEQLKGMGIKFNGKDVDLSSLPDADEEAEKRVV